MHAEQFENKCRHSGGIELSRLKRKVASVRLNYSNNEGLVRSSLFRRRLVVGGMIQLGSVEVWNI